MFLHPGIIECSVIGRPDTVFGEKIVAYITKKSADLTEEEIRSYCQDKLTEYKVPDFICFIDEIPKSGTGKILKTALKDFDKSNVTN